MRRQLQLSRSTVATVKSQLKNVENERDAIACGKLTAEDRADAAVRAQQRLQQKLDAQCDQVRKVRGLEAELLATKASETEARAELLSTKSALNLTEGDRWQDIQPIACTKYNMQHLLFNAGILQNALRKATAQHDAAQQEVQDLAQSVDGLRAKNRKHASTIKHLRTQELKHDRELKEMERDMEDLEKARLATPPTNDRKRPRLSAPDVTDGGIVLLGDPSPRGVGAGAKPPPTYTPYGSTVTPTNLAQPYGVPIAAPKPTFIKAKPVRPGMGNKRGSSAGSRGLYASAGHKKTTVSTSLTTATKGFNGMGGSSTVYKRLKVGSQYRSG